VIGPSGSGKTTLAKVAAGAVSPTAGVVRIDGANRLDWDPDLLGRYIGFLPQEPSLLQGTIADNISRFETFLGDDRRSIDDLVIAAAKLAGVHELILRFPNGYDYQIGPTGLGLSAGQAQRIAFARALYREPPILILDEPNAFLDAEGETALLGAIATMRTRGAAILMVAHRRSVLQDADRLIVMENGKAALSGAAHEVVSRLSGRPPEAVS
jgi:ATP-binding cassette subfamily C protein